MTIIRYLTLFSLLVLLAFPVESIATGKGKETGLPIPRFVSVRPDEANVRTGPGLNYPIKWVMVRKDMPVEIINEYNHWRKIRDIQNDEGWIHKGMLSGHRKGLIKGGDKKMYKSSSLNSSIVAVLEGGVIVDVKNCSNDFCEIEVEKVEGYIEKSSLWGVYSNEKF
jgi:SH3-like domain-containing protein